MEVALGSRRQRPNPPLLLNRITSKTPIRFLRTAQVYPMQEAVSTLEDQESLKQRLFFWEIAVSESRASPNAIAKIYSPRVTT